MYSDFINDAVCSVLLGMRDDPKVRFTVPVLLLLCPYNVTAAAVILDCSSF